MVNVAVATTVCKDGKHWYEQQLFWLNRTIPHFDHFVVAYGIDETEFSDSRVILADDQVSAERDHVLALQTILKFFRSVEYDYYLILDSDCFPIAEDWLMRLLKAMRQRSIAAPIRYENFDTYPHPCLFFLKPKALLLDLDFRATEYSNLIGRKVRDVGVALSKHASSWLPLIRTNQVNAHPVMSGIYFGSFYHHAAGSRWPEFRGTQEEFTRVDEEVLLAEQLTSEYFANPMGFVERLRCGI